MWTLRYRYLADRMTYDHAEPTADALLRWLGQLAYDVQVGVAVHAIAESPAETPDLGQKPGQVARSTAGKGEATAPQGSSRHQEAPTRPSSRQSPRRR